MSISFTKSKNKGLELTVYFTVFNALCLLKCGLATRSPVWWHNRATKPGRSERFETVVGFSRGYYRNGRFYAYYLHFFNVVITFAAKKL